jgi:hypothetical protein
MTKNMRSIKPGDQVTVQPLTVVDVSVNGVYVNDPHMKKFWLGNEKITSVIRRKITVRDRVRWTAGGRTIWTVENIIDDKWAVLTFSSMSYGSVKPEIVPLHELVLYGPSANV